MKRTAILLLLFSFLSCENMRFTKISGSVFDDETGEPLEGALVKLYGEYDSDSDETDENGRFSVSISYNNEPNESGDSANINFSVSKNGYKKFSDSYKGSYVDKEVDVFLEKE